MPRIVDLDIAVTLYVLEDNNGAVYIDPADLDGLCLSINGRRVVISVDEFSHNRPLTWLEDKFPPAERNNEPLTRESTSYRKPFYVSPSTDGY